MIRKSSLILIIISLLYPSLMADDLNYLYKIKNPDKEIIMYIEQSGGIINGYVPQKTAEAFMTTDMVEQVIKLGYQLEQIDQRALLIELDSLSSDHNIGSSYHSYEAVTFILDSLANLYPDICDVVSIGQTVEGRDMWTMLITDNPYIEEVEPELKYVANMHGDEMICQEIMLFLIEYLLQSYDSDSRIRQLIDSTEIWIMPNMNFDGSQELRRSNANEVDLNRNFPDRDPLYINPYSLQNETVNMINWSQAHNFVLSANFHSGHLVVNYPWDRNLDGSSNYAATPDDNTFIRLAKVYAEKNNPMYNSEYFPNGITNGAEWYSVAGGMMDWNYHYLSCMELTIEISEEKIPRADSLTFFWDNNRESMLCLLEQVFTGIKGTITDSITGAPLATEIRVNEIGKSIFSDPDSGDYYRLLEPGTYQILFEAEGYYPELIEDVSVDSGCVTQLDILLKPIIYYTIGGNITDTLSNENLSDVKLYIYQNESIIDSTISDLNGNYSIVLPEGRYSLITYREEYFQKQINIDLYNNLILDFQLVKIIPGYISGSVDMMDNGNYRGSIVYCQNKTDTLFTDNYFEIDNIRPGNIRIFVYQFGYITTQIDTFLENGGNLNLNNIELWPGSNTYFTDFEQASDLFSGSGDWQYDILSYGPYSAYSGYYSWATNPHENYSSGPQIHSLETDIFSIQGMVIPKLELYHWYDIENDYDGANVKISNDEGQNWYVLHPSPDYPVEALTDELNNPMMGESVYTGKIDSWENISFDLSDYIEWPFVKFRFDLGVDKQKNYAGWYLDDLKIFDANATDVNAEKMAYYNSDFEVNIYPNPANPTTKFSIITPKATEVGISIYNIRGQLIYTTSLKTKSNQLLEWRWEGVNSLNNFVATGIYFARVENPNICIVKKIILIR
jgi:hypothetical protein